MAEGRATRSSSRRITSQSPCPPSTATTAQAGPMTRARATRSTPTSGQVETAAIAPKTTRRNVSQGSMASLTSDCGDKPTRRTRRHKPQEVVGDDRSPSIPQTVRDDQAPTVAMTPRRMSQHSLGKDQSTTRRRNSPSAGAALLKKKMREGRLQSPMEPTRLVQPSKQTQERQSQIDSEDNIPSHPPQPTEEARQGLTIEEGTRPLQTAKAMLEDGRLDFLNDDVDPDQLSDQEESVKTPNDDSLFVQQSDDEVVAGRSPSVPPRSTLGMLEFSEAWTKTDKENPGRVGGRDEGSDRSPHEGREQGRLKVGFFDRHPSAKRIEFGTGFDDSQTDPGSSRKGKEPQPSSPNKRSRPTTENDTDSDDDYFETDPRTVNVSERRSQAPVKNKVQLNTTSTTPSRHGRRSPSRDTALLRMLREPGQSDWEPEADSPSMEETLPLRNYDDLRYIARRNQILSTQQAGGGGRRPRRDWSTEEVRVFQKYMGKYPKQFSQILKHDKARHGLLQERTQPDLKDKARNMAITMIKAGMGMEPGFEHVINPNTGKGKELRDAGYEW